MVTKALNRLKEFKITIETLDIFFKMLFCIVCFKRVGHVFEVCRLPYILFFQAVITHVHWRTFSALENCYFHLPSFGKGNLYVRGIIKSAVILPLKGNLPIVHTN